MTTYSRVDNQFLEQARRLGGHKTKKEAAIAALQAYVQRRAQVGILELFGTIDFDRSYDYKAERSGKRR